VCFGHQLLALLLGGKTERASQGWGMGIHRYQVTQKPSWMTPQTDTLDMMIWHQDQVTELPQGATLLASSEFCPNAAYAIGDQVLCFQGHPEFFHDYSRDLLVLRRHAYESSLYQSAIDSLDQAHQGSAVAEWMMRFITQGKAA
jgi:GMP synthase-like glutamine amidotransferase